MKPYARKALRAAAKLTAPICARCKPADGPYRCCGTEFCDLVQAGLDELGIVVEAPGTVDGLPFMGPDGCVVPPEYRPVCSGFVCPASASQTLIEKRDALIDSAAHDEDVRVLLAARSPEEVARNLLRSKGRSR